MEIKLGQPITIEIEGKSFEGIVTLLESSFYVVIYSDNQLVKYETFEICP